MKKRMGLDFEKIMKKSPDEMIYGITPLTKTDITNMLNKITGWKVYTFNSKNKMPTGAKGFVDHVMLNSNGHIVYIEVKLYKDRLSLEQKENEIRYHDMMRKNSMFHYWLMTEKNYHDIIEKIWGM